MSDGEQVLAQPVPQVAKAPRNKAVIVLAIVVVLETIVILGLGAVLACQFWTYGPMIGGPSADDQMAWMAADDLALQVGEYLVAGDAEGYMSLYDSDDPSVDFEKVKSDFVRASESATANAQYMSENYSTYEDEESGEMIVRTSVSGMDWDTGRPMGGRLSIYVNADTMMLTGKTGRTLKPSMVGW